MKKKVSILTMILACVLTCFCTFIVSGTNGIEEIKVLLNKNINVVVDGEVKNLYDVDGNRVYLISYNGTTYAPIRGVGELFDYEIDSKWFHKTLIKVGDREIAHAPLPILPYYDVPFKPTLLNLSENIYNIMDIVISETFSNIKLISIEVSTYTDSAIYKKS